MKILIMGGTKFVSRALAMYLIEKGHEVSIFTRNKAAVDYTGIAKHYIGDRRVLADLRQLDLNALLSKKSCQFQIVSA